MEPQHVAFMATLFIVHEKLKLIAVRSLNEDYPFKFFSRKIIPMLLIIIPKENIICLWKREEAGKHFIVFSCLKVFK